MAEPPFVVDLHAHFPMHIDGEAPRPTVKDALRRARQGHEKLGDRIKFGILEIADRFFNRERPTDGHAVTIDTLVAGNVGVALSVVYYPFDELDLEGPPGTPPHDAYGGPMFDLLQAVEAHVAADGRARVVRDMNELRAARAAGKVAMIHAVEGGFHLGGELETITRNVAKLADLGAGYVTVAHLLWRRVATNNAALPFLSDSTYDWLFPQDAVGLEERGRVMVREMVRHGVLVDLTHMSERGMDDVFTLLDELDPAREVPVFASHVACRMPNGFAYNLREPYVKRIAERRGVCGVIYCDHFVRDHAGGQTKTFDESFAFLKKQIDQLRAWGGDDVLAIGSDLDGFIKPTLAGLSSAANHKDLAERLCREYGAPLANKMCHENALRMFERGWRVRRSIEGAAAAE